MAIMWRTRFAALLAQLVFASQGVQPQAKAQVTRPPDVIEQVPIYRDGDALLVPVTVNGRVYPFILDTGASAVIYDSRLRTLLGPPQRVVTAELARSERKVELFDAPKASIGSLSLQTAEKVACMDLSHVRLGTGHDVHGFVGMSFLKQHVLTLDFDAGTLSFLRKPLGRSANSILLSETDGLPAVVVSIGGWGVQEFVIDTGSLGPCCGQLRKSEFAMLTRAGALTPIKTGLVSDASSDFHVQNGVIETIAIGSYQRNRCKFFDGGRHNTLGLGFWRHFNIVLDFPNQTMSLQANRQYADPDGSDRSGLHLLRGENGRVTVDEVDPESAAAAAGLRARDVLVSIDGTDTRKIRLHSLRGAYFRTGAKRRLRVEREGQTFDVTLVLPQK